MKGTELIINFVDDRAYLCDGAWLSFDQLGLPPVAKCFKSPAHWIVKVLNYRAAEKRLSASVVAYKFGNFDFQKHQTDLAETLQNIASVTFNNIDTEKMLATLRGQDRMIINAEYIEPDIFIALAEEASQTSIESANSKVIMLDETFFVTINDLKFRFGGVAFDHHFKGYNKSIELTIINYELREEFDAVKNYFSNALKTKKIQVVAHVEIVNDAITGMRAQSKEIDSIDKKMIDSVRFEFVREATRKKLKADVDKTLFTMDEYFESLTDKRLQANAFYSNENELFEDLISITQTKHYKHLRFLSSQHTFHIMKLRFVLKPFSFLFLLEGERHYHIVWETIDTKEATYIWHIDKDLSILKMTLRKIEDIINVIKVQGKIAYLNANEDSFQRIRHDYSELIDGFIKWKGELENYLT